MFVDAHVHVGPWVLPGLEILSRSLTDAVDAALVEGLGGMAVTRSDGGNNDDLRRAIADERRIALWFVPWIRPNTDEAVRLLEADGPRVAALKLHPSIDRTPPTDPGYDSLFALAETADLPVLIHTGRWQEVAGFELALQRSIAHPNVRIILAHAGGNDFGLRRRCADRLLELELEKVWLDLTGIGMPLFTRTLVDLLGPDRFLFGSDYPLGHPRVQLAHITAMGLDPEAKAKILGGTAQALFGLPSTPPARGQEDEAGLC